ncbi:MAG: hypothetical protein R3D89_05270 [Sphingomonadaceae bacterium]
MTESRFAARRARAMVEPGGQELLANEMRVRIGAVPHALEADDLPEYSWQLANGQFLLRTRGEHYFHYRRGEGVTIERGEGADASEEPLWLSGSVYSAVASINGFYPIHASAVCHEGAVHAFTGPSGAGKSTLCTALAARGLALFCDDTLVFDLSDPERVICLPGHKRLKLTEEALALTGAARQEKVGEAIEKFYAEPHALYRGGPLPLAELLFLEEGEDPRIEPLRGAERMVRLQDDHYTALHTAAARGFDAAGQFGHLATLAQRITASRFVRPWDQARFDAGADYVYSHIVGTCGKGEA